MAQCGEFAECADCVYGDGEHQNCAACEEGDEFQPAHPMAIGFGRDGRPIFRIYDSRIEFDDDIVGVEEAA